jgi:hypothetical protein
MIVSSLNVPVLLSYDTVAFTAGLSEGDWVVACKVGLLVGCDDGCLVGSVVCCLVGLLDGSPEGDAVISPLVSVPCAVYTMPVDQQQL